MPAVAQAQSTPVPSFTLKQVGANVWAAIDNPAAKGVAAANGGFVIGDDGVAVIDSFASANAAKELLTEAGTAFLRTLAPASSPTATCARGFTPRTCA